MARKRRKPKGKTINPTFYVFCEGETEEAHINFLKSTYRIPSIIIKTRVKGLDISSGYINNYLKGRPMHLKDKVFLCYDLDRKEILEKLQAIPDCNLLLSNPCIELWFLLHQKGQIVEIGSSECVEELIKRNKEYRKGDMDPKFLERLKENESKAIKRAEKLQPYYNPSTTLPLFLHTLHKLKK